jgi:phenylalanyl-tRNA synthetase alpha chain
MKDRLQALSERALALIAEADSAQALSDIETTVLGRKGELATLMRGIGELPPEERAGFGQAVNAAKAAIGEALEGRREAFRGARLQAELSDTRFDPTEPVLRPRAGHSHPVTLIRREVEEIFIGLGFDVVDGPEVETEEFNFDRLNIPRRCSCAR